MFTRQEVEAAPDVIRGKISLFDFEIYALIDPGATHSFIASTTASSLPITPGVLGKDLTVSTPLGDCIIVQTVYRDCPLMINKVDFPADLIVFPMLELVCNIRHGLVSQAPCYCKLLHQGNNF